MSARPDTIFDVSTIMTLLFISEDQDSQFQSDVSATVNGKVMWKNIENQNFGVKFIQNN